jgi:hypothetical protein
VTNAYNFLDIERGRTMAQDLFIGAFNIGINIDHTQDFVALHNLRSGVFWDEVENAKENGSEGFSGSLNLRRCEPAMRTDSAILSPWNCYSLVSRSIGFPYFSGTVASALQSATTHLGRARGKSKSRPI